uniref:Uncharacterized protein n=1 Tax=Arundo donax TaxID=35708 RepID=A0A0A9H677_ARUDO
MVNDTAPPRQVVYKWLKPKLPDHYS